MTTGHITSGNPTIYGWYDRVWSGANGKQNRCNAYTLVQTREKGNPYGGWCPSVDYYNHQWTSNDTLSLHQRAVNAVRGHSFNLGVAMAEGSQTVDLVKSTSAKFVKAIAALKHGRVDLALRSLGSSSRRRSRYSKLHHTDVGSLWLEIQYGWKPLLSDVYESAKAFHALAGPPREERVNCGGNFFSSSGTSYSGSPPPGNYYYGVEHSLTASRKLVVFVTENFSASNPARSLGLTDPLSIAWELLPFSFVADWFIPIGTYLDCLSVPPNCSCTGILTSRSEAVSNTIPTNMKNAWLGYKLASRSGVKVVFSREGYGFSSVPLPSFKPLPAAMSSGHIYNSIALIQQAFGSR